MSAPLLSFLLSLPYLWVPELWTGQLEPLGGRVKRKLSDSRRLPVIWIVIFMGH